MDRTGPDQERKGKEPGTVDGRESRVEMELREVEDLRSRL